MKETHALSPLDRSTCCTQKREEAARAPAAASPGGGGVGCRHRPPPPPPTWPAMAPGHPAAPALFQHANRPSHHLQFCSVTTRLNIISINSVPLGRLFANSSSTIVHTVVRALINE